MYTIDEKYDMVKKGVRLILSYNKDLNKFTGSIENIATKTLKKVRVEIHLSNGKELGPTTPENLKAGEKRQIELDAKGEVFDKWSTHAEVGSNEHAVGEKHKLEHSGKSDHNKE